MKLNPHATAPVLLILLILVGIPLGVLSYQSHRTGMTWSQIIRNGFVRGGSPDTTADRADTTALPKGKRTNFLKPRPIGEPFEEPPWVSHLSAVDLDQDGLLDVVVCDCRANGVGWIRQHPRGVFTEHVCADDLTAPAHVQAVDFDFDGDLDLVIAVLGMLFPNNDKIGSVVVLENDGRMAFTRHVIAHRIARVSDVRAGDLDGDGDMDLAVAQFGYDDGQTRWIENLGHWSFQSHILQNLSGPIHAEIADVNADGNPDIVVLVSQEWEQIYVFAGDGRGKFEPHRVFGSDNVDFGSSGISTCDFDQDGDVDILYTNGDAFDYLPPRPRAWHGVQWLENRGSLQFQYHRLADYAGAANAQAADVDRDGDLDLLVTSAYNLWEHPQAQSLIWLENKGAMTFQRHDVTNAPTHIQALDVGDFDGDGDTDAVSGGLHTYPPYDRTERVVLWICQWPESKNEK